jgi:prepilin peptidase CpaA
MDVGLVAPEDVQQVSSMGLTLIPSVVVVATVLIAMMTDVRSLQVRNWLTIPVLIGGVVYHGITSGFDGLLASSASVALVFIILVMPFALGAIGAGDVKLVAAITAWLGVSASFTVASIGFFITGIYALLVLMIQKRLATSWVTFKVSMLRLQMLARHIAVDNEYESVHAMAKSRVGRARLIPFSAMLGCAVLILFVWQFCKA